MRTLTKTFCEVCTAFLLTSCEETYNDKLFGPGELSQEYGYQSECERCLEKQNPDSGLSDDG